MAILAEAAHLFVRHGAESQSEEELSPGSCRTGNEYDGAMGLRISAIFVILVGSFLGAWFPIWAKRHAGKAVPSWSFFVAKYFGSGVIIATAFIHLLAPAEEALKNPCLTGTITEYVWVEAIVLMTIFVLFFVELMTVRYANFGHSHSHFHEHGGSHPDISKTQTDIETGTKSEGGHDGSRHTPDSYRDNPVSTAAVAPTHTPGADHLGHHRDHADHDENGHAVAESYASQMTAVFILEFGVIFHSIFIGLTLAVAGEEFKTLYVVLVFHQTFEGLGLGTRLSLAPWPKSTRWTPYALAIGYAISTPLAIAVGLGVRESYPPESATTLIVNGVFDSISAGILIYTGLVELMAHEFMFSPTMKRAPIKTVLAAFGMMCLGAALMALLGKWA